MGIGFKALSYSQVSLELSKLLPIQNVINEFNESINKVVMSMQ